MDVFKLTKKYEEQARKIDFIAQRIAEIESYLSQLTAPGDDDENVQSKPKKSSSVRTKRSSAKKS